MSEKLMYIQEHLDSPSYLSLKERKLMENFYCIPIEQSSKEILEELLFKYVGAYTVDNVILEKIIPFTDFLAYYNDMKIIFEYSESVVNEYSEEELIDNGFIKSEFVVHEHKATHLHWDFRFKTQYKTSAYSFAIPKAKMPELGDRILAVRQPMHPPVWVDLSSTTINSQTYGKGSVETIDRGTIFYKVKPKSFVVYIIGEKFKGAYYLIQTDGNNYLFVKSKNSILSAPDERFKELVRTVTHTWERDVNRIKESFKIDLSDVKTEPIELEYAQSVFIKEGFKTIEDYIRWEVAYRLGLHVWKAMNQYSQSYLIPVIDQCVFMNTRLAQKQQNDPMYPTYKFAELIASILNGRRMINGQNMEATIANAIKEHNTEEEVPSEDEGDSLEPLIIRNSDNRPADDDALQTDKTLVSNH